MKLFCLTVILLTFVPDISAQDSTVTMKRRFNLDIGIGSYELTNKKNTGGSSYLFGADIYNNNMFLRLGACVNEEFIFLGPSPAEKFNSYHVQIGREWLLGTRDKFGINDFGFKVSTGVGFTSGIYRGEFLYSTGGFLGSSYYSSYQFIVPSIPINIELVFKPSKIAGIGVMFFADFNNIRSYYGFAGKLSMGRIK